MNVRRLPNVTTHVTNTDNVDGFQPSYSSDGKKIAYTVYKVSNGEIYTIDVGGGGKTNLTKTANVDEYTPSWGSLHMLSWRSRP